MGQVHGRPRAWKRVVGSPGFCWERQKTRQNWEDGMCKRHLSVHCFCASAWPMVRCLPAQCLLRVSWSPVPFSLIFSLFPASHPITTGSTEPRCHSLTPYDSSRTASAFTDQDLLKQLEMSWSRWSWDSVFSVLILGLSQGLWVPPALMVIETDVFLHAPIFFYPLIPGESRAIANLGELS